MEKTLNDNDLSNLKCPVERPLTRIKKITTIYKLEKYMYSCLYNMFHI